MKKFISFFFATWFGTGYAPTSGTVGSAAALPFIFIIAHFGGGCAVLAFLIFVYVVGTFAVKEVLKYTSHDPSIVVIDEVAGMTLTLLPFANRFDDWRIWLGAFLFFRLFDITKPWPASYFDRRVMNAHGVMLDDVAAGIYAAIAVAIINYAGDAR